MKTSPIGVVLLGVLAAWLVFDSFYVVNGKQQVVVERFSNLSAVAQGPGVHAKLPVLDVLKRVDVRARVEVLPPVTLTLTDGAQTKLAGFAIWHIVDASRYLRQVGGGRTSLPADVIEAINRQLTTRLADKSMQDLVATDVSALLNDQTKDDLAAADAAGIAIVELGLLNVTWPDAARETVYARMRTQDTSRRDRDVTTTEEKAARIREQADAENATTLASGKLAAERVRAEGDAKAATIYATVYGRNPEFYRFWRSLEAYRHSFASGQDILVLGPDSEFFRYFRNPARH